MCLKSSKSNLNYEDTAKLNLYLNYPFITKKQMERTNRILTIDIMRGLTLFLMLFVNDLYVPGVPHWMVHTDANYDGMGPGDGWPYSFACENKYKTETLIFILHIH